MPSEYRYQIVDKYRVKAVLTQPMHVGSGNNDPEEVLVNPVTGLPFLQASGIAGVCRSFMEEKDPSVAEELFGSAKTRNGDTFGRLKFTDGFFAAKDGDSVSMELRPHVRINGDTGSVSSSIVKGTSRESGQKFNMAYIAAGNTLVFDIYLFSREDDRVKAGEELLDLLSAIHHEAITFGGKKSIGCGQVKIDKLLYKDFDLRDAKMRKAWADEDALADASFTEITSKLTVREYGQLAYQVEVSGSTKSLLVKCIAASGIGKGAADAENIQNAAGDYIIPGSSVKGVIRDRMEKIAYYLGEKSGAEGKYQTLLEDIFGTEPGKEDGKAGMIRFGDTIVGERSANELAALSHRIHVDKFTGGVMTGSLFAEKNVHGKLLMRIDIFKRDHCEAALSLLVLALRDIALGQASFGSGYGIGRGFIQADRIQISDRRNSKAALIDIAKGMIKDEDGILSGCMASLKGVAV